MTSPFIHTQSFNRSNLRYFIKKKLSDKKLIEDIAKYILERKTQSGIIYCLSRRDTEEVANDLMTAIPILKGKITFYHAELSSTEKDRRQKAWSKGDIKVICATIAFGMGINKPDGEYVFNLTFFFFFHFLILNFFHSALCHSPFSTKKPHQLLPGIWESRSRWSGL